MEGERFTDLVGRRLHWASIDAGDAERPLAIANRQIGRDRKSLRKGRQGRLGQPAEHRPDRDRAPQPEEMDAEPVGAGFRAVDEPVTLHGR